MNSGLLRSLRFRLERWVQRGIVHQLILMTGLIVLVAVLGGVAAWASTPSFDDLPTAVWWSFLRLTDPGYLGDDEGTALRVVSTIVTVLGYVLFMGSMIAILTQWLARTIRSLESGVTPIAMENHFVVLGWTNRTPEIVKKLLTAGGRLERFLAKRAGSSRLRIVILTDEVNAERLQELRDDLGEDWRERQVFLRSGSSLQREHLERLDLGRAAVVMIPGADFELGGAELTDTRVVKTLLTLDALFRDEPDGARPHVVAELFDPRKVTIARNSITLPTEIVAGDRLVSRLLSQSLRQPGIAKVLLGLLTYGEGNAVYLREFPELVGAQVRSLTAAFQRAVVLGVVTSSSGELRVHLDPADDVTLQSGDLLILIAKRYDEAVPTPVVGPADPQPLERVLHYARNTERRKLLILGWSYKISTLIEELMESNAGTLEVTNLSRVTAGERRKALQHVMDAHERLTLNTVEGDYSIERELAGVGPTDFDHILLLASGWMSTSEEADARTVLGVLLLRSLLRGRDRAPEVLVELLDPGNGPVLGQAADVVLVSPRMLSHLLAHVGLRPELNAVFDELICAGGSEIVLYRAGELGLDSQPVTFAQAQLAADSVGCTALGFLASIRPGAPQAAHLNPARDERWTLGGHDRVVLLSGEDRRASS